MVIQRGKKGWFQAKKKPGRDQALSIYMREGGHEGRQGEQTQLERQSSTRDEGGNTAAEKDEILYKNGWKTTILAGMGDGGGTRRRLARGGAKGIKIVEVGV